MVFGDGECAMCQVCKLEGVNWVFRNGNKRKLTREVFYRVYEREVKVIELCRICSIELFHLGESRFLINHPLLAVEILRSARRSEDRDYDFDFNFA